MNLRQYTTCSGCLLRKQFWHAGIGFSFQGLKKKGTKWIDNWQTLQRPLDVSGGRKRKFPSHTQLYFVPSIASVRRQLNSFVKIRFVWVAMHPSSPPKYIVCKERDITYRFFSLIRSDTSSMLIKWHSIAWNIGHSMLFWGLGIAVAIYRKMCKAFHRSSTIV